jgi:hypothetical protein
MLVALGSTEITHTESEDKVRHRDRALQILEQIAKQRQSTIEAEVKPVLLLEDAT